MKKQPWPDEENAIVVALYASEGWRAVNKLLPHRSEFAIRKQASRKGVAPGSPPPFLQVERDEASAEIGLAMRAWRYPVARGQLTPALRMQG